MAGPVWLYKNISLYRVFFCFSLFEEIEARVLLLVMIYLLFGDFFFLLILPHP